MKGIQISVSLAFLLSACSLGPDYKRPELKLPTTFSDQSQQQKSFANLPWWQVFNNKQLQALVREGLNNNRDLNVALARIQEASAILGVVRADQFPRIDLSGNSSRIGPSQEYLSIALAPRNNFSLLGNLSFELDFWGKLNSATAAKRAQLLSTEYAYRALNITIVSQIASLYFQLLDLNQRLVITEETLSSRSKSLEIITARFDQGVIPQLDVNQAEIEFYTAEIIKAATQREMQTTRNALVALLGRTSGGINVDTKDIDVINLAIPLGFPAELLIRRPDVKAAEELAKAAVAQISVAQANQLPSLSLVGTIGLESNDSSNLFRSSAQSWSIGGNLFGPLIDFGKNAAAVDVSEAQAKQAYLQYEQTVITAVREVEDAMAAEQTLKIELESRKKQIASAANATKLSRARYDNGVTTYLEVLDLERSLFEAQLQTSETQQRYNNAIVQLYKALGGGWNPRPTSTQKVENIKAINF